MGDTLVAIHRNEVCTRIKGGNVINAATHTVLDFGWIVISLTCIL